MAKSTKQILIIIDDKVERISLYNFLMNSGFITTEAKNGDEGVTIASRVKPDLILCNTRLDDMKGHEVVQVLSSLSSTSNIPFLFIENLSFTEREIYLANAFMNEDFVQSPFDPRLLISRIENRIDRQEKFQAHLKNNEEILSLLFSDEVIPKFKNEFSDLRNPRFFEKKEMVYRESESPQFLYFVKSGCVKIIKRNSYGKEFITQVISEGHFFGYRSLLIKAKHNNSAQTLEESSLLMVPKTAFYSLFESSKIFARKFIEMMSNTAINFEYDLVEMAYSSVRRKVAGALLAFANVDAVRPRIHLSVSREDLASKAGTAKETLIRTLSDFKSEGLIYTKGKVITILSLDGLRLMPQ